MRSKTSLFNGGIYRTTLKRFWPLWGAYAMLLFIITPLRIMGADVQNSELDYLVTGRILTDAWISGGIMSFAMAAATAMAVFSYLYSSKHTGMLTSLPVKREAMYVSVFCAGLTAMLASDIFVFAVTIISEAVAGKLVMSYLWQWLAIMVMMNLTFYGFAAFCAMLTGNIIVMPLVYGVLQLTAWAVENLVRALLNIFVFGMSTSGNTFTFLSPIVEIMSNQPGNRYVYDSISSGATEMTYMEPHLWIMLGSYCAAGVVFAVIGLLLYRKRRMETSTDVVAIKALRPVFKYCLAIGCALVLGVWLEYVLFGVTYSASKFHLIMLFMLAGSFIGYFAADMLMKKTFRVFSGNWKGFVILCCVILALMLCCRFDAFGYERHFPAAENVENVSISGNGDNIILYGKDNIAAAVELQKSIVANKAINSAGNSSYANFFIIYNMKDGKSIYRSYPVSMTDEQQADPASDMNKLQALINVQEAVQYRKQTSIPVTVKNISNAGISYYDAEDGAYTEYALTAEQAEDLYKNAIVPDTNSGGLGKIWLSPSGSDYYAKVYALSIYINLYDSSAAQSANGTDYNPKDYSYFQTTLTVDAEKTLKWLADNTDIVPVMQKDAEGVNGSEKTVAASEVRD